MSSRRELLVVLAVAAALLGLPGPAPAAAGSVIEPDTFADGYANGPGCTLREAIIASNTNNVFDYCHEGSGADAILLEGGVYRLSVGGSEDETAAGDLDVTGDLLIQGVGRGQTVIDATGLGDRVLELHGGNLILADLTIRGGDPSFNEGGGGILQTAGSLTLEGVRVTGNSSGGGGGILVPFAAGSLSIRGSVIDGNTAVGEGKGGAIFHQESGTSLEISDSQITDNRSHGGAIYSLSGDARIERSLIAGNSSYAVGSFPGTGGIRVSSQGSMRVVDSTIAGNSAPSGEGALLAEGPVILESVTVANNPGTVSLRGTILMSNSVVNNSSCAAGSVTSLGGNVEKGDTCGFGHPTDRRSTDPLLGPLADNGGPTETLALAPGSPAIGLASGCSVTDQRGASRTGPCDSGAYQLLTCKSVPVNVLGSPFVDRLRGTSSSDGILAFGGDDFVNGGGGKDAVCGGSGDDVVRGGSGKDTLVGESGNDKLAGGGGSDLLIGGSGKDRCRQAGGKGKARGCER